MVTTGGGREVLRAPEGEELRTEISAKFRKQRVTAELAEAALALEHLWTDLRGHYAFSLSRPH